MKKTILYLSFIGLLSGTNLNAQYCALTTGAPYSPNQPGIIAFNLHTISRASGNAESPTGTVVNTGLSATLTPGQTYTISITHSEDSQFFPGARNNLRVWIDYNNNFSFTDPGETVLSKDLENPNSTYTQTFTVPANTPTGTVRLRATAKMSADAGHTIPTPCDIPVDPIGYHGEMEDYNLLIVTTVPPATAHCTFPGRSPYSPNTPGITSVKLNTINRNSAATEGSSIYVNTGQTTTLAIGKTYTVSVTHTKDIFAYPNARNNIRIWADLNKNFEFGDAGESLLSINFVPAGVYTGTLKIPTSATVNTTCRLRVMVKQSGDAGNTLPSACDEPQDPQGFRGEVEDYEIALVANTTGIETESVPVSGVNLFPNPANNNEVMLSYTLTEYSPLTIEISDVNGKKIMESSYDKSFEPGAYEQKIKFENTAPGIYYVKLQAGVNTVYKKLVIQ